MIGYVQDRSARDWHAKINEWILELVAGKIADGSSWNADEILELLKENIYQGITYYRSTHSRTGYANYAKSNEITLHHLWITMNS